MKKPPVWSDTFIRSGLIKGWLIPPRGSRPQPVDNALNWVAWGAILLAVVGLGIFLLLE